ncbi:MAG: ribosome biogenesis GTPase Der [Candidatus Omnitrophica bacterium]|nr:ribosome biogenesis GTPase Der [Candidatus Omnitrophota bacterium]
MYSVAIVGRPNVGKSTLFNRIAGRRFSITQSAAGTTRDRVSQIVSLQDMRFELVDTGGFEFARKDDISGLVKRQIEIAISKSDAIIFVCDATSGVTPLDEELLLLLRKSGKPMMLAVNKTDAVKANGAAHEFYRFGMDKIYPISAIHNTGIGLLTDDLIERFLKSAPDKKSKTTIIVAVIGRPNVGKSSLINRLAKEDRVIVHEKPGTTRDSIDIHLESGDKDFVFIDTAGIRHNRKVKEPVDVYSLLRSKDSIRRSDVCVVIIDAYEGLTRDDARIINLVEENGKGCIILANKWDLVSHVEMSRYTDALIKKLDFLRLTPILFTSCKTGLNTDDVLPLIELVNNNLNAVFPAQELGNILRFIEEGSGMPKVISGRLIKINRIKQVASKPPTFILYVTRNTPHKKAIISTVRNVLHQELGLKGVPIRIIMRSTNKRKK